MKSSYILLAVVALALGLGVAARVRPQMNPDPRPVPQVATVAGSATGAVPGGIAWFQGSLEEGFSRTTLQAGPPGQSGEGHGRCLQPLSGDENCETGAWSLSVRILSRLVRLHWRMD